jgi:carbon storage regulator
MLVLSRKRNEQIVLELPDQTIRIQVVSVEGNRVRIGIDAPRDIQIKREELLVETSR